MTDDEWIICQMAAQDQELLRRMRNGGPQTRRAADYLDLVRDSSSGTEQRVQIIIYIGTDEYYGPKELVGYLDKQTLDGKPVLDRYRPVPGVQRDGRIIPAQLALFHGEPGDNRNRLFRFQARPQATLPGLETEYDVAPALPLALYDLGVQRGASGAGAPLPLRLWVEAILATPLDRRGLGQPQPVEIPLRTLIERLYPGRRAKPNEYLPALEAARQALAARDAGVPWDGGVRWIVTMTNFPEHLDDNVRLMVDLPPGAGKGPQVSDRLHLYGPKHGKAYRALLNFAYWWHEPGRTSMPADGRKGAHWLQVNDPKRYRKLTDEAKLHLVMPGSSYRRRRDALRQADQVIAQLIKDGEARWIGGKLLPPPRDGDDGR